MSTILLHTAKHEDTTRGAEATLVFAHSLDGPRTTWASPVASVTPQGERGHTLPTARKRRRSPTLSLEHPAKRTVFRDPLDLCLH